MDPSSLYERFSSRLWEADPARRPQWQRPVLHVFRLGVAVLRDMREGGYAERAASLSYTTLLSFAPLLAVMFSVLKGLGVHDVIEPFLKSFLEPLGSGGDEVTQRIVEFVEHIQISVLGAAGVALLLSNIVAMMRKIERAFNDIWRVRETRNTLLRVRDYLGVLMIGPVLLFLSIAMTAAIRHVSIASKWLHIDLSGGGFDAVFSIVPYALFIFAFALLFMFMPNTRVKPLPALAAGGVTGVVWKVLGKLFGLFVAGSSGYAAIYSAFAVMVLFMIWIYAGWMMVLAGAAVCYYLQNPSNQPLSRRVRHMGLRVREKIALQACAEIGAEFYKDGAPLTARQLAQRMKLPEIAVAEVTDGLVRQGILALTGAEGDRLIPARPFDATSVEKMLLALREADESGVLQERKIQVSPSVSAVLKVSDKAQHKELGKFTLKQLALGSIEA